MGGLIIAIDGPAASGKTTIAERLAIKLNLKMLDSGSLYRTVALRVIEAGIDPDDEARVKEIASKTMSELKIEFTEGGGVRLSFAGRDITEEIRSPLVNEVVSPVSEIAGVRAIMFEFQKRTAGTDAVVEGRDIGTAVFPDAGIKVYLDADIEERAKRRFAEQESMGIKQSFEEVREDINRRDSIDSGRRLSPLRQAPDALYIDTTGKEIDKVVDEIIAHLEGSR